MAKLCNNYLVLGHIIKNFWMHQEGWRVMQGTWAFNKKYSRQK